jgi:hypothetical protein
MSSYVRWTDIRASQVERVGGEQAVGYVALGLRARCALLADHGLALSKTIDQPIYRRHSAAERFVESRRFIVVFALWVKRRKTPPSLLIRLSTGPQPIGGIHPTPPIVHPFSLLLSQ